MSFLWVDLVSIAQLSSTLSKVLPFREVGCWGPSLAAASAWVGSLYVQLCHHLWDLCCPAGNSARATSCPEQGQGTLQLQCAVPLPTTLSQRCSPVRKWATGASTWSLPLPRSVTSLFSLSTTSVASSTPVVCRHCWCPFFLSCFFFFLAVPPISSDRPLLSLQFYAS